ncbi:MAG: type II toxin-antitoxin system VapC family toxin [Magnetococcales bacterium]|nr:type II toxin-antitoxin system VapC family toxin [Magnetococcales bacterium]
MTTLIVDASVVCKWYLPEDHRDLATGLLTERISLLAPELVFAEVGNVLWKWSRHGAIDRHGIDRIDRHLSQALQRIVPLSELFAAAFEITKIINHPIYDCFYLALAQRENVPLITADQRLIARLTGTAWAPLVIPLAQWSPLP